MPKSKISQVLAARIAAQQAWIDQHGGCLSAYVARYGSKDDANHYGGGGEAIYTADTDALFRLKLLAAQS